MQQDSGFQDLGLCGQRHALGRAEAELAGGEDGVQWTPTWLRDHCRSSARAVKWWRCILLGRGSLQNTAVIPSVYGGQLLATLCQGQGLLPGSPQKRHTTRPPMQTTGSSGPPALQGDRQPVALSSPDGFHVAALDESSSVSSQKVLQGGCQVTQVFTPQENGAIQHWQAGMCRQRGPGSDMKLSPTLATRDHSFVGCYAKSPHVACNGRGPHLP